MTPELTLRYIDSVPNKAEITKAIQKDCPEVHWYEVVDCLWTLHEDKLIEIELFKRIWRRSQRK